MITDDIIKSLMHGAADDEFDRLRQIVCCKPFHVAQCVREFVLGLATHGEEPRPFPRRSLLN